MCAGQGPPEEQTDRMRVCWGEVMDPYGERFIMHWLTQNSVSVSWGPSGANGGPSPKAQEVGH